MSSSDEGQMEEGGGGYPQGGGGGGYGGGDAPAGGSAGVYSDFIPPREWGREKQMAMPKGKIDKDKGLKKKAALTSRCCVCGAPAAEHVHYGAICCYSCRAFFRRSGARNYQCIRGDNLCEVNAKFRKYCKKCRYQKCIDSGMKPELVDASRRNKEADMKAMADKVTVKEEKYDEEDEEAGRRSPERAVSSSIKSEKPNSLSPRGVYADEEACSSSSRTHSPRGSVSPYGYGHGDEQQQQHQYPYNMYQRNRHSQEEDEDYQQDMYRNRENRASCELDQMRQNMLMSESAASRNFLQHLVEEKIRSQKLMEENIRKQQMDEKIRVQNMIESNINSQMSQSMSAQQLMEEKMAARQAQDKIRTQQMLEESLHGAAGGSPASANNPTVGVNRGMDMTAHTIIKDEMRARQMRDQQQLEERRRAQEIEERAEQMMKEKMRQQQQSIEAKAKQLMEEKLRSQQQLIEEKAQQLIEEKRRAQQLIEQQQKQLQQQQQQLKLQQQQQQLKLQQQQQQQLQNAARMDSWQKQNEGNAWIPGQGMTAGGGLNNSWEAALTAAQNEDNFAQHLSRMTAVADQRMGQVSTIRANPCLQLNTIQVARMDESNDDVMDIEEDDECKTGLCTAVVSQDGPANKSISSMFNMAPLIDCEDKNKNGIQRISVIQEGPRSASEEDLRMPLKKRNCTQMCKAFFRKFLFSEPIMKLTWEEKRFIQKRVMETRALVKMVQPQQPIKTENPSEGLKEGRRQALDSFRENFQGIFGMLRSKNIVEMDRLGLLEARFLCCALTSIGVRLYGAVESEEVMLEKKHQQTYNELLKSPWACSYEGEEKVIHTLETVGRTIGQDEKLEVLFTTCIMRGFQDPRASFMQLESGNRHTDRVEADDQPPAQSLYEEPGHPARNKAEVKCACEDPNLLTGTQFSLLMYRYLRDSKETAEAAEIFKRLEGMVRPLYECQNIFYFDRLPC